MIMKITKNFDRSEFTCNCGCKLNNIQTRLVHKLQEARDIAGIGFSITSGTRCPAHNKREGGLPSSAHITGHAADIAIADGHQRHVILSALLEAGFTRIGIAKGFLHVDVDHIKPSPTIWVY
jgi:zinc D-Ala-D-Ala carboxypeptidase